MQRSLLFILCGMFIFVAGCGNQGVKDAWKYTSKQYREYLNTPAEIDWDDTGSVEAYEIALSRHVMEADLQIDALVKAMENSDRRPDMEWVMTMVRRFPWLSGVAIIDNNGGIMAQYPEYSLKQFDASPLLETDPKQRMNALRAYVQQNPLGPEIYLGNPVYSSEQLMGVIVAHFDIRELLARSRNPDIFMVASPYGVLWPGSYQESATPVGQEDWAKTLLDDNRGFIGRGDDKFFWTTRYLGNMPLVYAIPVKGSSFEQDPSNMESLERVPASRSEYTGGGSNMPSLGIVDSILAPPSERAGSDDSGSEQLPDDTSSTESADTPVLDAPAEDEVSAE